MLKPESLELNEKGKMVVGKVRKGRECGPANFKDFGVYSEWDGEPLDSFEQVIMISFLLKRIAVGSQQRIDLQKHKDVKSLGKR